MEISFVTGKGGVGKSAVAAALAMRAAKAGKRCLLVELGNQSFYQDYLGLSKVQYQPISWRENLEVALWSGPECLKEYALHLLKVRSLYQLFFDNTVSRSLINVAPALSELAILGKITSGPPRNVGPKMPYDLIVVDAFASGHFSALLKAPLGMSEAIQFGPMGEQSRAIDRVLRDPQICQYYVVSIPEELPVTEGLDLAKSIEAIVGLKPTPILNRWLNVPESQLQVPVPLQPWYRHVSQLNNRQQAFLKRWQDFSSKTMSLPWILKNDSTQVLQGMSEALHD